MPDGWGFTEELDEEDEEEHHSEETTEEDEAIDIPLQDPTEGSDEQTTLDKAGKAGNEESGDVVEDEPTSSVDKDNEVLSNNEIDLPTEDTEEVETEDEDTVDDIDDQFDGAFNSDNAEEVMENNTEPDTDDTDTETGRTDTGSVDVSDIAPDVLTAEEAASREETWRVMVWGKEGLFKTHFCYTMPKPVILIDTEDKSHNIANKFAEDDIFIFPVNNYDEAKEALTKAIQILDRYANQTGEQGTIAVDSMSDMWTWAQFKHFQEWYPEYDNLEDAREEFESSLSSDGPGDWRQIKRYHNNEFRQVMLDTPYHICWTAKEQDDYVYENEDDDTQDTEVTKTVKAAGEKENKYEITDIIHATARNGKKVGDLLKSGLTNHVYYGLELPTFDKHRDVVQAIRDAESSDMPVEMADFDEHGVDIKMDVNAYE